MKKITLLIASLFITVGAMAQLTATSEITDDKIYTIESERAFLMYDAATFESKIISSNGKNTPVAAKVKNSKNVNQQFQIKTVDGSYYLYSVGAGKYLSEGNTLTTDPTNALTIRETTNANYKWYLQVGSHGLNSQDPNQTPEGIVVSSWTDEDAGNRFKIVEVEDVADLTVTTFNGSKGFNMARAYTATTTNRGGWTVKDDQFKSTNDAGDGTTSNKTDKNQQFAVLSADGVDFYLYSVGAGKFVNKDRTLSDTPNQAIEITAGTGTYAGRLRVNFKGIVDSYINLGASNQMTIDGWDEIDDGNAIQFLEVAYFDPTEALEKMALVNVTYQFVYDGDVVAEEVIKALPGASYPAFATVLPYGVTATMPEDVVGDVDHAKEIQLAVEEELPFEYVATGTPKQWYYAQLHTNYPSYIRVNDDNNLYWKVSNNTVTTIAKADVDAFSWGFVGDLFGGFKMVNKNGKAVKMADDGTVTTVAEAEATNFIATPSIVDGKFCLYAKNAGGYINAQAKIARWTANDAGSTFMLTERNFDVTISDLGYATLFLDRKVYIPEGVEAYVVKSDNALEKDGYIQFTQVTGILPENTGVVLKNENAGTYEFTTSIENATADVANNMLTGTVVDAEIAKEAGNSYYILANVDNVVGFYGAKYGEDETKFKNYANKAYLVIPATQSLGAAFYGFDWGGTTGIDEITDNRVQSTVIYDLTGRRVETITEPGIYIVGGKKVLVK